MLPERSLGLILFEVLHDIVELVQCLRYHLQAVVKGGDLALRPTFASGELLYVEVVMFDGISCYINSKLDHVLLFFDIFVHTWVAADDGIAEVWVQRGAA